MCGPDRWYRWSHVGLGPHHDHGRNNHVSVFALEALLGPALKYQFNSYYATNINENVWINVTPEPLIDEIWIRDRLEIA